MARRVLSAAALVPHECLRAGRLAGLGAEPEPLVGHHPVPVRHRPCPVVAPSRRGSGRRGASSRGRPRHEERQLALSPCLSWAPGASRQQCARCSGGQPRGVMARMGHSSTRAALLYQDASTDHDRAIAGAVSGMVGMPRRGRADDGERVTRERVTVSCLRTSRTDVSGHGGRSGSAVDGGVGVTLDGVQGASGHHRCCCGGAPPG
jgi:hypothetical protein